MIKKSKTLLKSLFIFLFFAFSNTFCFSQNATSQSSFWQNVRFGGGIGLGFTNGGFNGSISPSAIYDVNDYFSAGVGLSVNYAKYDTNKFLAYGGSIVTFYNPIPLLQLSAEIEQLRVNESNAIFENDYWSPALFLGAGYRSNNVTFGIRYDVLYDDNKSIYANAWMPFVRVYF